MIRYMRMEDFLQELKALATHGFHPFEVQEFLVATLIEPASLAPYLSFRTDRYTRNLVYKDDAFELLRVS